MVGGGDVLLAGGGAFPDIGVGWADAVAGTRFGATLAAGGDLDGDGLADLLVGAPEDGGAGAALLFLGPLDGSAAAGVWRGGQPADAFGTALDVAGDLDLDGSGDLLFAAPGADTAAAGGGAVYLFHAPFVGSFTTGDAYAIVAGAGLQDALGTAARGGQDLTFDGFPDLAVGLPGAFPDLAGSVAILPGGPGL